MMDYIYFSCIKLEFLVSYIKVSNLSLAIKKFKQNNYWVFGFDNNWKESNTNLNLHNRVVLVFGAEEKGLRNLTIKECDQILKIPINTINNFGVESLNVANACAIALYEFNRFNNK